MPAEERPIPDSYWVVPGGLLAGEYPGARNPKEARQKLQRLLEAGVSLFLDLTEEGEHELQPYEPLAKEEALRMDRGVTHRRMPIRDQGTPTAEQMKRILDAMDAALQAGETVYVHCWGGIGRTGTVVGCYLVRHGLSGPEALQLIRRLRAGMPDGWRRSPENNEQEQRVLGWQRTANLMRGEPPRHS